MRLKAGPRMGGSEPDRLFELVAPPPVHLHGVIRDLKVPDEDE